jgi:hypothetical protein
MALELEAKLIKIFPEKSGDGKNGRWVKQEFLVETKETYPKKIFFSAWGDKAEGIKNLSVGDTIKISFFAESREFNEKYYTDLKVWKIEKLIYKDALNEEGGQVADEPEQTEEPLLTKDEPDDLPF